MKRSNYWNKKYYYYWNKRTKEAENQTLSEIVPGDSVTTKKSTYQFLIDELSISENDKILEVGCGFGRNIDYLFSKSHQIFGLDISKEMICECRKNYNDKIILGLVSEAEKIPFKDNYFDKIICFAVFDALFQKESLIGFNQKLIKGGKILITGKNDNYFENDKQAYTAEINARKKGHPNFFTDVNILLNNIDKFGYKLLKFYQYKYRGNFSNNNISLMKSNKFYEYCLLLEKTDYINNDMLKDIYISSKYSKTFKLLNHNV